MAAVAFTAAVCVIGLLAAAWLALIPGPVGASLFCATFFPGVFLLISVMADVSERGFRGWKALRLSLMEGAQWFLWWVVAMTAASTAAAILYLLIAIAGS